VKQSPAWWQDRSKIFLGECACLLETAIGTEAVEAIFLCGSFASGEESVVLETEIPLLLSDVDLVVIIKSGDDSRMWFSRRGELGESCEKLLPEVHFSGHVDVGVMIADDLRRLPPRPGVFDMRQRGRVLSGAPLILNCIPDYRASDISTREAILLVENRGVALLDSCPDCSPAGTREPYRFLYGVARVYTDLAAAALSIAGLYIPGYLARRDLLRTEVAEKQHPVLSSLVSPDVLSKVDRWTRFKINPSTDEGEPLSSATSREGIWTEAARDVLRFWSRGMAHCRGSRTDLSDSAIAKALAGTPMDFRGWRSHLIAWRSFLSRFPALKAVLLEASLGKSMVGATPLDMVRREGLRLLDHRVTRGPGVPVKGCRFGFPHHGGSWRHAAVELHSLWTELVFGRTGA
jgi:predicted nucleotidyltransferase